MVIKQLPQAMIGQRGCLGFQNPDTFWLVNIVWGFTVWVAMFTSPAKLRSSEDQKQA